MKSIKVVRDMFEYLILFGHRDNEKDYRRLITTLNWVLDGKIE
jgi:hypothetical protein